MTPQIDCLRKTSSVLRVSTHIYGFSEEINGKTFILRVNLGMWPLKSIVLEKRALFWGLNTHLWGFSGDRWENMYSQPPVATQHKKTNKVVWTCKDDWPPKRTSTYKRPFTREGNYLVAICVTMVIFPVTCKTFSEIPFYFYGIWDFSIYITSQMLLILHMSSIWDTYSWMLLTLYMLYTASLESASST